MDKRTDLEPEGTRESESSLALEPDDSDPEPREALTGSTPERCTFPYQIELPERPLAIFLKICSWLPVAPAHSQSATDLAFVERHLSGIPVKHHGLGKSHGG